MKALELARIYWKHIAKPDLMRTFPKMIPRIAVGLVGNGSECFGYDDQISQDHDWGVDFFLWVSAEDRENIADLLEWKRDLFAKSPPPYIRTASAYGAEITCMEINSFYESLIGFAESPQDVLDWRLAPEENYALAVNGEVFWDGLGKFTSIRRKLLEYYPEDLRRKKIVARCVGIAQTGQYNFQRMLSRGDRVAVFTVLNRFVQEVMGIVFHLNRVYRPYYKWTWKKISELPVLGEEISSLLLGLVSIDGWERSDHQKRHMIIDEICALLVLELQHQKLTNRDDDFLLSHAEAIQETIQHEILRTLPLQYE